MKSYLVLMSYLSFAMMAACASPNAESIFSLDHSQDTTLIDLHKMAFKIADDDDAPMQKTDNVIRWVNQNFTWTDTDYQKRTVKEIIARKGGNCNEQAVVVRALLNELGVKTRKVAEINIQPKNEERQESAAALVKEKGLKYSMFGLQHNDHRWIEFYDATTGMWIPADPTLGLLGLEKWIKARVGFAARPTHAILPSRDMLVPIAVFAVDEQEEHILEDRSQFYLIDGFNEVYQGELEDQQAWQDWVLLIREISSHCKGAMLWQENLHEYDSMIGEVKTVYEQLKQEMQYTN